MWTQEDYGCKDYRECNDFSYFKRFFRWQIPDFTLSVPFLMNRQWEMEGDDYSLQLFINWTPFVAVIPTSKWGEIYNGPYFATYGRSYGWQSNQISNRSCLSFIITHYFRTTTTTSSERLLHSSSMWKCHFCKIYKLNNHVLINKFIKNSLSMATHERVRLEKSVCTATVKRKITFINNLCSSKVILRDVLSYITFSFFAPLALSLWFVFICSLSSQIIVSRLMPSITLPIWHVQL